MLNRKSVRKLYQKIMMVEETVLTESEDSEKSLDEKLEQFGINKNKKK